MTLERFRTANQLDAVVIANLVNKAYHPDPMTPGWTHESHWVSGNRTTVDKLAEILSGTGSVILVGLKANQIVACVQVKQDGNISKIGMLAVDPAQQATGIGKQILAYAEAFSIAHFGARTFILAVISERAELINFYKRRGYHKTSTEIDYRLLPDAGIPKTPGLKVAFLEKHV